MEEIIQCHWYFFVLFWKLIKLKHKYPIVNSYINTPNLVCVRAKEKQNVSRKKNLCWIFIVPLGIFIPDLVYKFFLHYLVFKGFEPYQIDLNWSRMLPSQTPSNQFEILAGIPFHKQIIEREKALLLTVYVEASLRNWLVCKLAGYFTN